MKKWTVAVLFGGQSGTHARSCAAAAELMAALDEEKYDVLPVGITPKGNWRICHGSADVIRQGRWEPYSVDAILSPDASRKCLMKLVGGKFKEISVDAAIPVLSDPVQGLLEMAQIPCVGGGALSAAIASDRLCTRRLAQGAKIPMTNYLWCRSTSLAGAGEKFMDRVEKKLGYPCSVKPSRVYATEGVSLAKNREELEKALSYAAKYDRKIVVEEAADGRTFVCAVLGEGKNQMRLLGERVEKAEDTAPSLVPASVDAAALAQMRKISEKIYDAVDASAIARVDFFMEKSGRVLFDQWQTMPGLTPMWAYPMLWEEAGVSKTEWMDARIAQALAGGIHG